LIARELINLGNLITNVLKLVILSVATQSWLKKVLIDINHLKEVDLFIPKRHYLNT